MNMAKTTLTPRLPQFQYTRLEHQTQAVDSIARVFGNVPFVAASASHAGKCAGRVVEITISSALPSTPNAMSLNVLASSRSSSSACATAVWKSTSHSVGASSW